MENKTISFTISDSFSNMNESNNLINDDSLDLNQFEMFFNKDIDLEKKRDVNVENIVKLQKKSSNQDFNKKERFPINTQSQEKKFDKLNKGELPIVLNKLFSKDKQMNFLAYSSFIPSIYQIPVNFAPQIYPPINQNIYQQFIPFSPYMQNQHTSGIIPNTGNVKNKKFNITNNSNPRLLAIDKFNSFINSNINHIEYITSTSEGFNLFTSLISQLEHFQETFYVNIVFSLIINNIKLFLFKANNTKILNIIIKRLSHTQLSQLWKIILDEKLFLSSNCYILESVFLLLSFTKDNKLQIEITENFLYDLENTINHQNILPLLKHIIVTFNQICIKLLSQNILENVYTYSKMIPSVELICFLSNKATCLSASYKKNFINKIITFFPHFAFKLLGSKIVLSVIQNWGPEICSDIIDYFNQNYYEMLNGIYSNLLVIAISEMYIQIGMKVSLLIFI